MHPKVFPPFTRAPSRLVVTRSDNDRSWFNIPEMEKFAPPRRETRE